MTEIVPAIIPHSFNDLEEHISRVRPYVKTVQIDIMDGRFTPEPSWPFTEGLLGFPNGAPLARYAPLTFELDMMILGPEQYIDAWSVFGINTFIIHIGTTGDIKELIRTIKGRGRGVAIAIRPQDGPEAILPYVNDVDFVQCMGNNKIGFHGISLDEKALVLIADLRKRHTGLIIANDIGVNSETASKLVAAGVNKLVSGSAIFESNTIEDTIQKLAQTGT